MTVCKDGVYIKIMEVFIIKHTSVPLTIHEMTVGISHNLQAVVKSPISQPEISQNNEK